MPLTVVPVPSRAVRCLARVLARCRVGCLAALALGVALAGAAAATTLTGQVTHVIDGDSVRFQPARGGPTLEVRLKDIDAPEGCQAGGEAARDFLQDLVRGKTVQLLQRGQDHYGRTLGVLQLDGVDLNQRLVAEGHAWALRSRGRPGPYTPQETMAQALKRGLHAERGAIHPGEFRRRNGPCGDRAPARAVPSAAPRPAPAVAAPRPPEPRAADTGALRCDGRTMCSQMRSCAEARYFLANCPGVKMDGNNDGVPCERQWCTP